MLKRSVGASPLLIIGVIALSLVIIFMATFLGLFTQSRSAPLAKATGRTGYVAADCISPTFDPVKIKDQAKFAAAIQKYIGLSSASSPFLRPNDLSADFVTGAIASGVNPAYLTNIARKESIYGTAGIARSYPAAHNAFGRTATVSQPHVKGKDRLWYRYDSFAASLPEQSAYIKRKYFDQGLTTFEQIISAYAPPGENNTSLYITQMQEWVAELISSASDGLDCAATTSLPTASAPPAVSAPAPTHQSSPTYRLP